MGHRRIPTGLLLCWLVATLAGAQTPYPITPLVVEGDTVPGIGTITTIDNVAVNDLGDWLVEADTDFADTSTDSVLLLNGVLHLREGDALPAPPGAGLGNFDSINLNVNGDSGWNFFLDGPPSSEDSGLYFNTTLVVQESDISTAPEFSPGTPYIGFFDAKLGSPDLMMTVASVDDPAIASTVDRAIVRLGLDGAGALLFESVLAKEGDVLPQQVEAVADFGTGPHQSAINLAGQVLFFADLAGDTSTDGAIYLDQMLVAQEGDPSPVAGRAYELLSSRSLDLNGLGDVVFKANVDGLTTDDEMIVRNGEAFVREGDSLPAIDPFTLTAFGTGSGPVVVDDNRNVLWFGDWNDANTDVDTGLFLNDLLLVQEGVTQIGGQLVDTISSTSDAFTISDNGRFIIFEATLVGGINGAFMIEVTSAPAVPDGEVVPGTSMTAALNANGIDIDISWDVATCTADEYHLFFGNLSGVSTLSYTGGACGLGTSGLATFTPPEGSVFWVVVSADSSNIEGVHGFDGGGAPRNASAGGLCDVMAQVNGSSCP